ncbi:hypothetical protein B6U79_00385 [Candidatus Bathyarchaeota archaeon ex4484_231]|nr:MAG: hypothetical protein B6U79_00385 [Candidatus Bathyarchaeota archaeon ex4484_231]RJS74650.1 MAG: hypothetical protein CW712_06165 [Candidatus Bathyarchaeota archaeon]
MGTEEIKKEYGRFKLDLERMVEEELRQIDKKIKALETEVEIVGKETEEELNNNNESKKG